MKIIFLTNGNHPGTLGGVQTFNRVLKKYFGKSLITVTNKVREKKYFEIEDLIEVGYNNILYRIFNKLLNKKLTQFLIKEKIKRIKPDVCILSSPQEIENLRNISCKKILVQHLNYDNYLNLKDYINSDLKLIEILKKELDYFVFLSENDLKRFNKELKYPLEKSRVIRHTSELENFNGRKNKNKNLIMLGRIENKQKRYDLVILAMKKITDFTLLIYGDGPDLEQLKTLVIKEKIKNVIFKGSTNDVAKALDEASIFIMTSDCEGYPISTIEATKRGLPIILRNTFEAAEDIVINNRNGILLEKNWNEDKFIEAIQKIYNNYDYYQKNTMLIRKKYDNSLIKDKWFQLLNDQLRGEKK